MPFFTSRPPPFVQVRIDWSHPITRDLRFFVVFRSGIPVDLVTGAVGTLNGPPNYVTSLDGLAMDFDNSDYVDFADDDRWDITNEITLMWRGVCDDFSNYRNFMGKHASNGASANPFEYRADVTTGQAVLVRANTDYAAYNGPALTAGKLHHVGVSQNTSLNTTAVFYLDGAQSNGSQSHSTAGGTWATANSVSLKVGRRTDGATQMDGRVSFVAGWARDMDAAQHVSMWRNPWQFLVPVGRFVPVKAPAGGGVSGSAAQTLGALSQSAAGKVGHVGAAAQTLAALSQSAAGTVGHKGNAAQTLGDLSQSAAGKVGHVGAAAQTLAALSQSAAGKVGHVGTAGQTLGNIIQSAQGDVGAGVFGSAAQTLGDLIQDATGVTTASAAGDYGVKSEGRGRKRRYFIELDGRRVFGKRVELDQLLQRRYPKPPQVQQPERRLAEASASSTKPQNIRPEPVAALQPIDLSGIEAAQRAVEIARQMAEWDEEAAIALLLN